MIEALFSFGNRPGLHVRLLIANILNPMLFRTFKCCVRVVICFLIIVSFGCNGENYLNDTEWQLYKYGLKPNLNLAVGKATIQNVSSDASCTITFEPAQRTFNGKIACNQYSGKYEIKDDKITFSQVNISQKNCEGLNLREDLGEQIREFNIALRTVSEWKIKNGNLMLRYDDDKILIFKNKRNTK